MSKLLGFLLTVAMIVYNGNGINWQGTGNMSLDNMTFIWNYINTNFKKSWKHDTLVFIEDTKLIDFCAGLSDHLNHQWDQAWNVVVVYANDDSSDSVLYGYAFRNHWMWFNGYKMDDNSSVCFVIWKDYNCIGWITFNENLIFGAYPSSFSDQYHAQSIKSTISNIYQTLDEKQIWLTAKALVDLLESNQNIKENLGQDIAFSVIMNPDKFIKFFGKFCAKDYLQYYEPVLSTWGRALILQMR